VRRPSKKSGSQAEGVRGSLWSYLPHEYTIVGFDTDELDHELCHHASNQHSAEDDEADIASVRYHGVIEPVVFRRGPGGRLEIVDGRTRVRWARAAAPLYAEDRRREGLKGDDCVLRVRGVVEQGAVEDLFCVSRAANRRRPEDPALEQAKDVAKVMNRGASEAQAAIKLGLPISRVRQLRALLQLDPKLQRKVGAGVSLDAAAQLAKLPAAEQIAKVAEIEQSGEKPTARAVRTKLAEGTGKAPGETPAQKIKRIAAAIQTRLDGRTLECETEDLIDEIQAILRPQTNGTAHPAEQTAEFGS
jgi:ParB-like chromosome segregation protein Spo0J